MKRLYIIVEEYDPDQGERINNPPFITEEMAKRIFSMFWGREDVYAKRGKSGGYFPKCDNRWNDRICPKQRGEKLFCDECENTKWTRLDVKKIIAHLLGYKEDGSDVIGVYPLLPNGTCRFIVFDFDNHEKGAEATETEQEDGRILRSLKFRFPVFFNNQELYELDWDNESTVETV